MRKGTVQHVRNLLQRYTALQAPETTVIEVFVRIVQEVCGITIKEELVRYSVHTKTIGLGFAGPRKTEIALQQRHILVECRKVLGEKNAPKAIV